MTTLPSVPFSDAESARRSADDPVWADAEFVAHARADLPRLLAAVRVLLAEREA